MTMKERIKVINTVAQDDFVRAEGMLDMLNEICGTKFGFCARRVVIFKNPDGSICEKYADFNDAYTNLQ